MIRLLRMWIRDRLQARREKTWTTPRHPGIVAGARVVNWWVESDVGTPVAWENGEPVKWAVDIPGWTAVKDVPGKPVKR